MNLGIPADVIIDMIDKLRAQASRCARSRSSGRRCRSRRRARSTCPRSWVQRYEAHNPAKREVLTVATTVADSPAAEFFRSGDILLSIDGQLANTFRRPSARRRSRPWRSRCSATAEEVKGKVDTVTIDGLGIERVVSWAGALIQAPHRELAVQRGVGTGGVYVSFFNFGSPASRSGLYAGRRIVAVDGQPTPDLDAFVRVASSSVTRLRCGSTRCRSTTYPKSSR